MGYNSGTLELSPMVFVIWLLTVSAGCNKKETLLIEEDKMVHIMADLNLSDQIIRRYPALYRDSVRIILTESLLKIHNVSQEQLDTNLYLYQFDLDRYKSVSDKVLKRLESMQK